MLSEAGRVTTRSFQTHALKPSGSKFGWLVQAFLASEAEIFCSNAGGVQARPQSPPEILSLHSGESTATLHRLLMDTLCALEVIPVWLAP